MTRANKPADSSLSGVLVLDKPVGMSSAAAVAAVRRKAGGTKTGHAGTLDPLAVGVLLIMVGRATKQARALVAAPKRYRTIVDLSAFTTTDDLQGERTEVHVSRPPCVQEVRGVLEQFTGTINQRPPVFSAVKIEGRRAYKMARRGEPVELRPRPVTVHAIDLLGYEWPQLELDIRCGPGVYIRSLARDIGTALGTGGHCKMLRRTAVGPFDESMIVRLNDLPERLSGDDLIDVERALAMVGEL